MISTINKSWDWIGVAAKEIVKINDFGNVIFKTENNEYWRICPEELFCIKIAESQFDYEKLLDNAEFLEDWEMTNLVKMANEKVGALKKGEKYCLKIAGVLGGKYQMENIGKITHEEQISFSGDLAKQIKNLPDGTEFKLKIK